ncbi:nuclear pore complex protein NUP98A [Argentina anserina]|uniref:nuclear pore complex protein NUP98A n=1 Tax=Argentina anserina TaxID=57926 RepID=UPI0021764569|nr:nuclear pore complex protein NUP98A-like [Potentilla anserina]XP_050376887.1 nuclear pore complex protein NUP98A-like [Potentilla anserina]
MFGSTSPFGQSSNSPFGSQSVFGQSSNTSNNNPFAPQPQPQPFGSTNAFGAQTGSSLFGGTSTGVFGQTQSSPFGASSSPAFGQQSSPFGASSTPAFGASSTPAFGASSTPAFGASSAQTSPFGGASGSSAFGQKPAFGAFGASPAQTSPFGGTAQPSQPAFGSNMFGATSSPFGASQPAFGTNTTSAFGSTNTSAFGSQATPGFGSQPTPAFGATSTSPFGGTSTAFGAVSTPAFGSTPTPAFGATNSSLFGTGAAFGTTPSTPAFGQSSSAFGTTTSSPTFGQSSSGFGFSGAPAFGQSSSAFGSTPFGASSPFGGQSSPFGNAGAQAATPTLGNNAFGQSTFGAQAAQRGGSRATPYTSTSEPDSNGIAKLESISAMAAYKEKSHEELRWEDYQLGDKGGPSAAGGGGFASPVQTNPLNPNPATSFPQTSSSPFNTSTSPSLFAPKTSSFPSTGFGVTSSSPFSSTSPFASSSTQTNFFSPASSTFGQTAAPSPFSSTPSFSFSTPVTSSTPSFNFPTQSNPQTQFGQTSTGSFGLNTSTFGSNLFNNTSGLQSNSLGTTSNQLGISQPAPAFPNFQTSQPLQTNPFSFSNNTFSQPQPGNTAFGGLAGISGPSNFGQLSVAQGSAAVQQPVPATNPFGTLPTMPQVSIGRGGSAPSIQYGISSMPVVDKPAHVRVTSILTPRHLSQRRIRLPARKYNPKNDNPKAFFSDDEETPTTPKGDVVFHPRENPRALVIRPQEQWPLRASAEKSTAQKNTAAPVHENGKNPGAALFVGANSADNNEPETLQENGPVKEHLSHVKANQKHNGVYVDHTIQKGDSLSGHRAGEAAIVYEHGADIEAQMPKLRRSDYYTEPRIQELAAKERADPGFCCRVKDFVVGRHGYGSIKFLGETDVRRLDLEGLVQFNNKEVIVYPDENKKPPVGQGLNKPAEVTLLNIKCIEKKTGFQYTEGPKVEKYKEMLKRKAEEQGAKFVSYDPKKEEWTFMVDHFSGYNLKDEDECDVDAAEDC